MYFSEHPIESRSDLIQSDTLYQMNFETNNVIFDDTMIEKMKTMFCVHFDVFNVSKNGKEIMWLTQFDNISINKMCFNQQFDQPIEINLPNNTREIQFGFKFNQTIKDNCLPSNLKILSFVGNMTKNYQKNFRSLKNYHFMVHSINISQENYQTR